MDNKVRDVDSVSRTSPGATNHFSFLLLKGFSVLSYVTAVDTLRIANRAAGRTLFTWVTLSEDGEAVTSNQGLQHSVDAKIGPLGRRTTLLVCGGEKIERASTPRVLGWVREQAAHGCHVGGLCTAAWTLAEAGLLNEARTTIHWESEDSFAETFPDITLTGTPFIIDGNRSASAGGTSAIDLMLEVIALRTDRDLALSTAERMIYGSIHKLQGKTMITPSHRIGLATPKIRQAIECMEKHLEEDLAPAEIAEELGFSVRQLERLFRQHLKQSPKKYFTGMRLDRAQRLLLQSSMSVLEVATATGFNSASHFSKTFRKRFGSSPYSMRALHD